MLILPPIFQRSDSDKKINTLSSPQRKTFRTCNAQN
ncbi:hypothetical protein SPAB_03325 [Salmonella enterica subsp. enterica serovar Paratyphi B str. SPB7]|uniref:Uncharacterized protein n=1 Tax=Salmonella paratyphi B (strain ATCC BAA-1250 / SPB7) TaxID=1016998 RepID=A0A6C6Z4N3_SALPB|nr:hypothetical protein SPAB_03325 [Salmonella enterica subsp. enterica serovar Paratyphi B str. SPB7]